MFDMQKVAKTISTLRKERNMTQMELADRLGISFQAVSNWERGQTMPDISKLSELSGIFGVTIDDLLGNGKSAKVVEKLIHEEPVEEELTTEDFLDVAPFVKPKQADMLIDKIHESLSMKGLTLAAPFISTDTLDALAVKTAKAEKNFEDMIGLLPFISKDAINQCIDFVTEDGIKAKKLVAAAPFIGKKNVSKLADKVLEEGGMKDLVALAPFMPQDKLDAMAVQAAKREKSFDGMIGLLPFISRDAIDQCLEYVTEDGIEIKKLIAAAPFIGKANVDKLADRMVNEGGSLKELVALAPFMKRKKLTEMAFKYAQKEGFSGILPLLPFLDQEALDELFQRRKANKE